MSCYTILYDVSYMIVHSGIFCYARGTGSTQCPPPPLGTPAAIALLFLLSLVNVVIVLVSLFYVYVCLLLDVIVLLLLNRFATVSFHNFKSQNFKLSISNPKSKYVAYVYVLSQISNCQGLGRKNTFEILKTDRSNSNTLGEISGAGSPGSGRPCPRM